MYTTGMFLPMLLPLTYLLVIMGAMIGIRLFFINIRYKKSRYGVVSGNNFFNTVFDKGNYGEFLTFGLLEKLPGENRLLTNIYVPKEDGTTTEIDVLMINRSGLYVFESKNYSGWIFGDEKSKNWTQSLKGGKKNKFFNPIWQNKAHMGALTKLLGEIDSSLLHSYVVFSERCELKKITMTSQNVKVLKRNALYAALKKDIVSKQQVLSEEHVAHLFERLEKHSLADEDTKKGHIQNVKEKLEKTVQ
ncbi:nuclease-related domain-containing protein [Anaerotalea alkaliphila]|uniref:NERD domain-containing protein n=1 Tax=Anaerotalea alkaliphila TaxID=2662126 RepID=A0A7X5HUU0_9FIRM|nr:nuclease-related domain-containing protein [Anaerotalea alkaliphila]NDL67073.1 NERD domain-containing protein [Anaerotalea alkaliphila]